MGRSLSADFVLGVDLQKYDPDTYEYIEVLPEELKERLADEYEFEEDGLTFGTFYTMDEECAFGTRIEWIFDYVSEFDADAIAKARDDLLSKVKDIFKRLGVRDEPKLLLVLDYS